MDGIAASMPPINASVQVLSGRLDTLEEKIDRSVTLGEEHVRIARMWERTEAPGRSVKRDPPNQPGGK